MAFTPRLESLFIKNLRSVGDDGIEINFPQNGALVLLGENNAGKSNITRGLDLIFGERWPGSRRLEEHDFHGRDSDGVAVEIIAKVSGIICTYCGTDYIRQIKWVHDSQIPAHDGNPVTYRMACSNQYCNKTFVNNQVRGLLSAAVIDANRRLDYQLSYASKFTMLSKLMHRFHERLLSDADRKKKLTQIFNGLIKEFDGVPEFSEFKKLLATTAEDLGQNLSYRLDIDFSAYDPSNFFRSLRVHPSLEGEVRSFDELGTGQSQILALAFAYAYARAYGRSEGTILVIDEPEANLHPLAQKWLARRLDELSEPGLQVIVTTHSPHFVNMAKPENLVLVKKLEDDGTRVIQHTLESLKANLVRQGADEIRTQPNTIGPFYAASATTELLSGLFARRCVLVEGPTEALALPELLQARGLNVLKEGIAIVSVEGIGNIAKWYRLYTALGIDCFPLFDTDSNETKQREIEKLRNQRLDIAAALGMTTDPAENATIEEASLIVNQNHAMMNPDFEGTMTSLFGSHWERLYSEASSVVGDSKSLRARYAAQKLTADNYSGKPGEMIDLLISRLTGRQTEDEWPANSPINSPWDYEDPTAARPEAPISAEPTATADAWDAFAPDAWNSPATDPWGPPATDPWGPPNGSPNFRPWGTGQDT